MTDQVSDHDNAVKCLLAETLNESLNCCVYFEHEHLQFRIPIKNFHRQKTKIERVDSCQTKNRNDDMSDSPEFQT
jgi:hypothetical protein